MGDRTLVMGIVNVTPDSFSARGPLDVDAAVRLALAMDRDGADLIDVGGESTRPGALPVSDDEEAARVLPVIRALAGEVAAPLSIDTYKASVAREALRLGASLVNDISGLQYDGDLAGAVAQAGAALILMHTRGRPTSMYAAADYEDLVAEVAGELAASMERAVAAGVPREQLLVDPGIGFAKRASHSYGVLARLSEFGDRLGRPLVVGPSRKSFMSAAIGSPPPAERDWGTAAAITAAVLGGAHIVRVHAVKEMRQVVDVADEIRRAVP